MMDAHQRFAFDSELCVGVLGKGGEFILVPLGDGSYDEAAIQAACDRGFHYCGCLGIKDGMPGAKSESDPDSLFCCLLASFEFARLVRDRLQPLPTNAAGDAVEFLTRLHELPDTREERELKIARRLRAMSTR